MRNITLAVILLALVIVFSVKESSAMELSKNDQMFREDIQEKLSPRNLSQINGVINGYKLKISKMDTASANALTDSILAKLDAILLRMKSAEFLDKDLDRVPSTKYRAYMLIKFELTLLR